MTGKSERKSEIEAKVGQAVSSVQLDIDTMKDLGVLVDVDVHGASMFTRRVTWQELGVPKHDTRRKRLRRGYKDLIPTIYARQLRSLESRFRQSLEKHSFILQGFRPWKWVPFTAYASWQKDWDLLQKDLEDLKSAILSHYDDFKDDLAEDWTAIAHESWDAILARREGDEHFVLVTIDGSFDNVKQFAAHVVAKAQKQLPSPQAIKNDLYVDYRNAMVVTGADVQQEATERLKARAEGDRILQARRVERRREQQVLSQIRLEEREAEQQSLVKRMALKAKMEAMRTAELEHAREQIANTISPFTEVMEQFRAQIFQDVQEISRSIGKHGHVKGRVAQRARGLLETYRLLGAATGDDELATGLAELQGSLDMPSSEKGIKYNTGAVESALTDLITLTHEAAKEVSTRMGAHTRAGALEI